MSSTWENNASLHATAKQRLGGEHLRRFHLDHTQHLATYPIFHGDEDGRKSGLHLTKSAFQRGALGTLGPSPYSTSKAAGKLSLHGAGKGASATLNRTADRDLSHATLVRPGALIPQGTVTLNGRMFTSTGTPYDSGVTYLYQTGEYTSKTGLPPLAFKPWSTEYIDEYREPADVRESLRNLTARFGTSDALKSSRFQLNGYPPSKTLLESSLTRRLQTAPAYETRVTAF